MNVFYEQGRKIPIVDNYDVIVCGGGPAGFVAAIASAREGAKTLLLERYGFLGGTATAGMMVEFGAIYDGKEVIVGGITHEFLHRLEKYGGAEMRDSNTHSMVFDPESMITVCQKMILEAGVDLLFHSLAVNSISEGNQVTGIIMESKSGREVVAGKVVIDTTGDGDVAARSGAEFRIGRERDDRLLQPATLEIMLGNVDVTRIPKNAGEELIPKIKEARRKGDWPIPTEQLFSWGRVKKRGAADNPQASFFFINGTNLLDVDGTSVKSLTRAEIETRNQVEALVKFLRKYVPGFEECYLDRTATQVGIRETRRIIGDYTLTQEDVLSAKHFSDGVVPSCNSIDVHNVKGRKFKHDYLKPGTHYEIPYRCFLPAGLDNILIAGRCLSADHSALGSARVMVVCMPMGEACGTAAAFSVDKYCSPRTLPVNELKIVLRKRGTVI